MRSIALGALALMAECCTPAPVPAVAPATVIYLELVEAGCLGADDGGATVIAQEHALPDQPAWLACLFDAGSVTSCTVPCSAGDTHHGP